MSSSLSTGACSRADGVPLQGVPVVEAYPVRRPAPAVTALESAAPHGFGLDSVLPEQLRSVARFVVGSGITALLLASMGVWSLWLAIFAVMATLLANGVLISFSTRGIDDSQDSHLGRYSPVSDTGGPSQLDFRTCAQAYTMVPVTVLSVVCLALYKADEDEEGKGSPGQLEATKLAAVGFLQFVGLGRLLHGPDTTPDREGTVLALHSKFISVTMFASIAYLVLLGVRALFPESSSSVGLPPPRTSVMLSVARLAFALSVGLLVFAVVGFSPILLSMVALGISATATGSMLWALSSGEASRLTVLQAHSFSVITLSCLYCTGCALLEQATIDADEPHYKVKLRLIGFELAFAAASWFAFTLAVRDYFKTLQLRPRG